MVEGSGIEIVSIQIDPPRIPYHVTGPEFGRRYFPNRDIPVFTVGDPADVEIDANPPSIERPGKP